MNDARVLAAVALALVAINITIMASLLLDFMHPL